MIFEISLEMQHLNVAPNMAPLSLFDNGVLTISHMSGAYKLTCMSPLGGGRGLWVGIICCLRSSIVGC